MDEDEFTSEFTDAEFDEYLNSIVKDLNKCKSSLENLLSEVTENMPKRIKKFQDVLNGPVMDFLFFVAVMRKINGGH